jgi:DNA topoisomerase-6 subunit B
LAEVAGAVETINGTKRHRLYEQLVRVAKRKTAEADVKIDDRGRKLEGEENFGGNVLIVDDTDQKVEELLAQATKPEPQLRLF